MKHFAIAALLVLFALPLAAQTSAGGAIDPHAARIANDVSHDILSPFCPGKTLAMCPSPAAAEVRMKIQDMAESGMEEQQIKEAIIEEHGEEFRTAEPPWTDDIGLLGALGGGLALAFGIVVFISRRRAAGDESKREPAESGTTEGGDDPYLAELRKQYKD